MDILQGKIVSPAKRREDAFGFLRLALATLVIVSHTPELVDGNRSREILSRLFGTISFGEMAVDGFFVISGFFITGSFIKSASAREYFTKRVARIYPGFIVAWIISIFLFVPLGGGTIDVSLSQIIKSLLLLEEPALGVASGAFNGQINPALNGSMWTIQYEFRCYIAVVLIGLMGLLKQSPIILCMTLSSFVMYILPLDDVYKYIMLHLPQSGILIGDLRQSFRLTGCFLTGTCYYIFRQRISFRKRGVALAMPALLVALSIDTLADAGFAVFGGYIIFYIGKVGASAFLRRINNPVDVSYGLYLYAWPIGKLVMWWLPAAPLLIIGFMTFVASYVAGWLSWHFVEKRVLAMVAHAPKQNRTWPASVAIGPTPTGLPVCGLDHSHDSCSP